VVAAVVAAWGGRLWWSLVVVVAAVVIVARGSEGRENPAMGGPTVIQVVFLKYDGSPHRSYPARYLGADENGTWLGVTSGTPARVDGTRETLREEPYVLLVPRNSWWTAMFNAPPRRTEVYCDITTPATWSESQVTVVDLDLDVRRRRWGEIERLDEVEFQEHRIRYGYPDEVVAEATAASLWLAKALGDGTEPFATGFRPWLAQVSELSGW
jgi:protein associated with RNAse G/E